MASLLGGSVGRGGFNDPADVRVVQHLLNDVGTPGVTPLKVDGVVGPLTVSAILAFQRSSGGSTDGRIDPTGATLKRLISRHFANIGQGVEPGLRTTLAPAIAAGGAPPLDHGRLQQLLAEYFRMLKSL
jgi:peptidoglycan hydrolase-like protein with peptidoglycan-binding domain